MSKILKYMGEVEYFFSPISSLYDPGTKPDIYLKNGDWKIDGIPIGRKPEEVL